MVIKNVVLVGATGLVGSHILTALAASPSNFNITILSRPDSKSNQPEGFEIVKYDYSDTSLVDALRGQDAIICAVSSDAILHQIPLINSAISAGVKRFVPTEFGSDTLNPVLPTLISWYRDKKTVQSHLERVAKENPGFGYTSIISGPFFTWGITSGFLGYDTGTHTAKIYDGGCLKISYSEIFQVGLAVTRALEMDVTGYLKISSITATQNEIIDALERISGEKWERRAETTQEAFAMSAKMMKSQDDDVRMKGCMLRAMRWVYGADCSGDWGKGDNEKLRLEEGNLDDFARIALAK